MNLEDSGGRVLELDLLRYQFPDRQASATRGASEISDDLKSRMVYTKDDDNWLIVGGRVETELGNWTFTDPCLQTWDAERLAAWLTEAASSERPIEISFTEPNLAYSILPSESDVHSRHLVINFSHEASPHGRQPNDSNPRQWSSTSAPKTPTVPLTSASSSESSCCCSSVDDDGR